MNPLEFLEAIKNGSYVPLKEEKDCADLTSVKKRTLEFVIQENDNCRAPNISELVRKASISSRQVYYLVEYGFLQNPSIVEIAKVFFHLRGSRWYAQEPVYSTFIKDLEELRGRHADGMNWHEKFQNPRRFKSKYFALVSVEGKPAYWKMFYRNYPLQIQ